MNGTASLANGEIGRVLPANDRKVLFSGAVEHLNEAATAPYFGDLSGESPETQDCLAEGGGFELPVPICEQSDDGIRLSFATSKRTAKRYRPGRAG
jgi:hypothetical protein